MKILFISPNSPWESVGGIERYIINLINYYKQSACEIYLILPTTGQNRIEKEGRVTIYHDHCLLIPREVNRCKKEIAKNARLFSLLVGKIITQQKIEIICAENIMFGPPAIYSLLLNMIASVNQIPLVLRLHSFAKTDLQIELVNQLMWNKISCVSQSVTGDCFQKGTDIDLLSTHFLGVNTLEFNERKDAKKGQKAKIILTATRIISGTKNILAGKGVINLIKAFAKISPRYPNLSLLIAVGMPPENLQNEFKEAFEMLLGYLKLYGVEKRTRVENFQLAEMPDVYKQADLFVLTSENETFGQVFLEAMASGLPVIGTKVGGVPEIISDSYNGYLVMPNDASILAQKIEKLINDEQLRNKFIKAGLKIVQNNFTAEKQFAAFHEILEKTVTEAICFQADALNNNLFSG